MEALPSSLRDKTNGAQKFLAIVIMGAVLYGIAKVLNHVLPTFTELIKNIWLLLAYGVPLAIILLYVISNPLLIWGFFKTLSWKLTSFLVKMDPLSVMDRYVEYLKKKWAGLNDSITVLVGKKRKLERKIADLTSRMKENAQLGAAAMKTNNSAAASMYGTKVATDQGTLKMLTPMEARMDKSLDFMTKLSDNWKYGIEQLEFQIGAKREEYEIIKETTKGLKSAEDFINSDDEAAKLYGMSLKALEETVTQQIGYIDEFERKSKDIMAGIDIEKQARTDAGLQALEEFMKADAPTLNINTSSIEPIAFTQVQPVPVFNLLKNKTQ
jgi:phage shock protein A